MEKLITPYKKNHFFGYYDKSPLNYDKTYVISHEVESSGRRIKKTDSAKICITNLQKKTTKEIDEQMKTLLENLKQNFDIKI